ncbi:MAG: hypothetical protein A3D18_00625 [Chlamydiae bacterium RIFCSPHIGHO2_02_FULL_49_29]|nr:MAG: hypothetical protein A3D18_00625 [Chlamydiae bacterium RIFCSPHIGHO2_02_FULL_49_29]
MGTRYYDPRSGRFLSPDPVGYPLCLDLYAYAYRPLSNKLLKASQLGMVRVWRQRLEPQTMLFGGFFARKGYNSNDVEVGALAQTRNLRQNHQILLDST